MEKIVERALRLKELEKLIVKSIIDWNADNISKYINEFRETRKQIRLTLMDNPVISGIYNDRALAVIKTISSDEKFPFEMALDEGFIDAFLTDELSIEELEEIGEEEFHTWFSHLEYAKARFTFGSLIIQVGKVPKNLEKFVIEARECFIFQRFLAFFCLCRTIVEISVKDICQRKGIIPKDTKKISHINRLDLRAMIDKVSKGEINRRLHEIRQRTNAIIHGNKIVKISLKEARDDLREIISVIQELYSYNGY